MNHKILVSLLCLFAVVSCDDESSPSAFIDYGFIPEGAGRDNNTARFQSAVYYGGAVLVATNDGIWKLDIKTKQWTRFGLAGKNISVFYQNPMHVRTLFAGTVSNGTPDNKTFHISHDFGVTWQTANAPVYDNVNEQYENYVSLAVPPDDYSGYIYANLSGGTTMAVSLDGGMNWERINHATESSIGPPSVITFLPGNNRYIFQGAESPENEGWLGKYEIDREDPVKVNNFTKIIDSDALGDSRPTDFATFSYVDNILYVGLAGGLMRIEYDESGVGMHGYISKAGDINLDPDNQFPHTNIHGIWVDPTDPEHVLFGGSNNTNNQTFLYSYQKGEETGSIWGYYTIKLYREKFGLENPEVVEIVSTYRYPDYFPAIVLSDQVTKKMKVVLYTGD